MHKLNFFKFKINFNFKFILWVMVVGALSGSCLLKIGLELSLNVPPKGYLFEIDPKEDLKTILNKLRTDRVLPNLNYYVFRLVTKFNGSDRKIKAGEYFLKPYATTKELITKLIHGKVELHKFTIVEGSRVDQILANLRSDPFIQNTLSQQLTCKELLQLLDPKLDPKISAGEGLFMPDTYVFVKNTKDLVILQKAYMALQQRLADLWEQNSSQTTLKTRYEALILGSIIEKETCLQQEMKRVAGVYHRRLQIGIPLQADPTVIYGAKIFDRNLTRADLKIPSKYNTYLNRGLPPTPIATPSIAAIFAALNPADEEYLYFVADGSGGHVFSRSLFEHNQARIRIKNKMLEVSTTVEHENAAKVVHN